MFLWGWLPHEGRNANFKLMLKRELKKFPIIGNRPLFLFFLPFSSLLCILYIHYFYFAAIQVPWIDSRTF
jgi:hypothetical protein